jgi:hypothetical protein
MSHLSGYDLPGLARHCQAEGSRAVASTVFLAVSSNGPSMVPVAEFHFFFNSASQFCTSVNSAPGCPVSYAIANFFPSPVTS